MRRLLLVWRLAKGYRLTPWRSPYLRWRIETYSGLHADRITARQFFRFCWTHRRELLRYLDWAANLRSSASHRKTFQSGMHRRPPPDGSG